MIQYEIGDIVKLKKKHPCGSFEWEVLRVGADFRLKCIGCGHQIMIARRLVEKTPGEFGKKGNKDLHSCQAYDKIQIRDILFILASHGVGRPETKRR